MSIWLVGPACPLIVKYKISKFIFMPFGEQDTIAAIATPAGEGAISVIRVSGSKSFTVVDRIFRGNVRVSDAESHTVHLGRIHSPEGEVVDQVIATVFRGPRSYTGEDVVEIGCHGGILVTRRILECLLIPGVRHADPGEFTKRAFINGKLDLSQAEAVADLISSRSRRAQISSVAHLQGKLGERLKQMRKTIVDLCSLLELEFDFAEEGIELTAPSELTQKIEFTSDQLAKLILSYESGRVIRDGFSICIVGKTNVGKSSIFNSLLMSDRSIVTSIPGTTRDTIEESISLDGYLFKLTDTAGIRDTFDQVEARGVDRTKRTMESTDAICYVVDVTAESSNIFVEELKVRYPNKQSLVVHNKIDLASMSPEIQHIGGARHIYLSAASGGGINLLKDSFVDLLHDRCGQIGSDLQITSLRHLESLSRAKSSLDRALGLANVRSSSELLTFEIRESANAIGEITGEVTSDEILNNIFSSFCIGK